MAIFEPRPLQVPGLLPDDAYQEQLKQYTDAQKKQLTAQPPNSAVDMPNRIADYLEPVPHVARIEGAGPTQMTQPARQTVQNVGRAFGAAEGDLGQWGSELSAMGTLGAEDSAAATAENVADAQEWQKAIDAKAMARAKMRSLTDLQRSDLGVPLPPVKRSLLDLGAEALHDIEMQQEAAEGVARAKGVPITQAWWLNALQTGGRSFAQIGTGAVRGLGTLIDMTSDAGVRAVMQEAQGIKPDFVPGAMPTQWVKGVDEALTKMLPGDPGRAKDFMTQLAAGSGSMLAFLTAGAVGGLAGLPTVLSAGGLGALVGGDQAFQDAAKYNAQTWQKYLSFLSGSAMGVTEAFPIDRMFLRANRASGGFITDLLAKTRAGSLEEFIQEAGQALGFDLTAKYLAQYDPERSIDAARIFEQGLVGAITGGVAAAGVTIVQRNAGITDERPKAPEGPDADPNAPPPPTPEEQEMDEAADRFDAIIQEINAIPGVETGETTTPQGDTQREAASATEAIEPIDTQSEAGTAGRVLSVTTPAGPAASIRLDTDQDGVPQLSVVDETPRYRGGTPPSPLREDQKVELTHWSPVPRAQLDPSRMGTGPLRGGERQRLAGETDLGRTYYGVNARGTLSAKERRKIPFAEQRKMGYVREGGLGSARHVVGVDPNDLYNWYEDPLGLKAGLDRELAPSEQVTQYERLIKQAGFKGFWIDEGDLGQVAALFTPETPEAIIDERTGEPIEVAEETADELAMLAPEVAERLMDQVPGFGAVLPYLTDDEAVRVQRRASAQKLVDIFESLPDAQEMAAVAVAGSAKRGWYANSAKALIDIFGLNDAPRFAALLAALSPQTSVETNTVNAINMWVAWINAGRPREPKKIKRLMAKSIGLGNMSSVLPAWVDNTIRALETADALAIELSGPKVSSFMKNLQGVTNEVTNDTWMANFANIEQSIFRGQYVKEEGTGRKIGVKGPGYIAMSVAARRAAEAASQLTGDTWTAAEVQETVWSWSKALYEKLTYGASNKPMAETDMSLREIIDALALSDEEIAATPDFAKLFVGGIYRQLLEKGGYGEALKAAEGGRGPDEGDRGGGAQEAAPARQAAAGDLTPHLRRAAERLDQVRQRRLRQSETPVGDVPTYEAAEQVPFESEFSAEDIDDFLAQVAPDDSDMLPLPGLPQSSTGPVGSVVQAARAYAASRGIPLRRQSEYVRVDPDRGARIAAAYDAMEHAPEDPAVQASYAALVEETLAQYQFVKASGLVVEFIEPGQPDPYPEGPKQVLDDLQRGHLWTFPTDQGFGTLTEITDNPMLTPVDEWVGRRQLVANDVFRIVHDFFGHGLEGSGFGARGEENAWQSHMRLFSEEAIPAMTSETRGQNSWVNFGPFGEQNRANQRETVYADQKVGLMPPWTWTEGVEDNEDFLAQKAAEEVTPGTAAFQSWFSDSVMRDRDGEPIQMHHGSNARFAEFMAPSPKANDGIYFSSDRDYAAGYAEVRASLDGEPVLYTTYLSIKNPLVINGENRDTWNEYTHRGMDVAALREEGYDGVVVYYQDGEVEAMVFDAEQVRVTGTDTLAADANLASRTPSAGSQPLKGSRERAPVADTGQEANDVRLSQIAQAFRKLLDLTVRQGRLAISGSRVMGVYNRKAAVVRLRTWDDLDTLVHEGFHALHDSSAGELTNWINLRGDELMKVADQLYGRGVIDTAMLPRATHIMEGFSEFGRVYVLNRPFAQRYFPQLTAEFEQLMEREAPDVARGLNGVGAAYDAYQAAPSTQVLASMIVPGLREEGMNAAMAELREKGFKSWMAERTRRAVQTTLNRNMPLNYAVNQILTIGQRQAGKAIDLKASEDPRILARLAPQSGSRAMVQVTDGVMPHKSIEPATKGLREALLIAHGMSPTETPSAFDPKVMEDFSAYLVGLRVLDEYRRLSEGKLRRAPIKMREADVKQAVSDLHQKYGKPFDDAATIVHEYGMALWEKAHDAGLMPDEVYDTGLDRRFYVPLQRDMSDKKRDFRPGAVTGGRSIVKKFSGSDRNIIDPIAVLMEKTFALEATIADNEIKKAFAVLADRAGKAGAIAERIPASRMKAMTWTTAEVARQLTKDDTLTDVDAQDLVEILSASIKDGNLLTMFSREQVSTLGENVVFFWENGKVAALQLMDGEVGADLMDLFNAVGHENMDIGMELIAGTSTVFRNMITKWPDFLIVNFIRDQLSSWMLNDVGYIPFASGIGGIREEIRQKNWARAANASMMTMGGMNTAALHEARTTRDVSALRAKGYLAKVFSDHSAMGLTRGFSRITELSETGSRIALYKRYFERAKRDGLTDWDASIEAAYGATDTMDFGLNGSRMLIVRRLVPFFNAQLQGYYKLARTLGADEARQRLGIKFVLTAYFKGTKGMDLSRRERLAIATGRKLFIKMVGIGTMGAALSALFWDDEDYQEVSDYVRATSWVIPLGDGKVVAIPKPFELAIFSNAFERAVEHATGDDQALARFRRGLALTMTLPVTPPLIGLTFESAANYDYFSGREIVPDYMQRLPAELQFNNYTSDFAKAVAGAMPEWTGLNSPMIMEHWLAGLGASAYRDIATITNAVNPNRPSVDPSDMPIVRRFWRDVHRGSAASKDFWKIASTRGGTLEQAAAGYKTYVENGNQAAANRFLATLPQDDQAYALLMTHYKAEAKRLNPFYRARQVNTVVSGMRRELGSELPIEITEKGAEGEGIRLTAKAKREIDNLLSELARRETRNTLVATGTPGWGQREALDVETTMNLIDAASPAVYDELQRRMVKAKVYDGRAVFETWPEVRDRLLSDREEAFLDDLVSEAKP